MDTKHEINTDFCVVGGGLAGVCAALAAARNGTRVVLIQDRAVLGGNSSSEIRMHIVGANSHAKKPGARETGILEELRVEDAWRNPQRAFPLWDLLLYEKVKAEPNLTLLLQTDCVACETETRDGRITIRRVHAFRRSTEDQFEINAPLFADCSGDGRLGMTAGADCRMGREGRDEFGETLAPEKADRSTLGSSILYTARKHDRPMPFHPPAFARKMQASDFKFRGVQSYDYGFWWCEWGGQLDIIKDNETIRHELLRTVTGIWDYVKNSGAHPDSANWALDWVGAIPGKRESRRFLGDHILTEHDVLGGAIFPDQVAYGGWPIDLHPPEGVDAPDQPPCEQHDFAHLFSIPLRCLYSRNVSNLFFAGRNISASHVAFASTRVMGTCAVVGQAVGTAAAAMTQKKQSDIRACDVAEVQQMLLRDDAYLLTVPNRDPADRARHAHVTAASEQIAHPAASVIDGITRARHSVWGEWSDEASHQWRSEKLPATLELTWPEPIAISGIQLTFDTGLERELFLTPSEHASRGVVRAPQPELVKNYKILLDDVEVARVENNLQRQRRHRFAATTKAKKLQLVVESAQGVSEARVYEIRVY